MMRKDDEEDARSTSTPLPSSSSSFSFSSNEYGFHPSCSNARQSKHTPTHRLVIFGRRRRHPHGRGSSAITLHARFHAASLDARVASLPYVQGVSTLSVLRAYARKANFSFET